MVGAVEVSKTRARKLRTLCRLDAVMKPCSPSGSAKPKCPLARWRLPWKRMAPPRCRSRAPHCVRWRTATTSGAMMLCPSVVFQDDDPKLDKASSAGRRKGGINASPCKAQARASSLSGTAQSDTRSVSPRSTTKKIYPSVQVRLLIQLEQLEGEAKAAFCDSIMKSTDGFQYANPQKIAQAT